MAVRLTDEQYRQVLDAYERAGSVRGAARLLGIPAGTMGHRLESARKWAAEGRPERSVVIESEAPFDEPPVSSTERQRLQDEITRLRAELRDVNREKITMETVRKEIFGLSDVELDPPTWLLGDLPDPRSPGIPTLFLSDLHWGEVVDKTEMRGLNEYNASIARDRIRRVVRGAIELCLTHTAAPEYPGIICALGGDMVSGDIHEELADTNDMRSIPAAIDCAKHLAASLLLLAEAFGKVYVPCVDGNHDRTGKRIRYKERTRHSYGWLIYQMLEQQLQEDDRIQFAISDETDLIYDVAGWRMCLTHGDEIGARGGDGIIGALGPIKRGSLRVFDQHAAVGKKPDIVAMGHWHQPLWLGNIIVNNTLKGWDEYAKSKLRIPPHPASQVLWWTHPRYRVSRFEEVYAERPPERASNAAWSSWEAA